MAQLLNFFVINPVSAQSTTLWYAVITFVREIAKHVPEIPMDESSSITPMAKTLFFKSAVEGLTIYHSKINSTTIN
jgi:hypothetical protein